MYKEKKLKNIIITVGIIYLILAVINLFIYDGSLEGIGDRWILKFGDNFFLGQINPMTLIMSLAVMGIFLLFIKGLKFERIPGRKQSLIEMVLDYFWQLTDETVPVQKYKKPTFVISMTLFFYILISNVLSGIPGISTTSVGGDLKAINLFTDTWYTPTSDLNVNVVYAVMVLLVGHAFAIKSKGLKNWLKTFLSPTPLMLPMNIIGEIAKPVSHSLRLFGNIMGGGILVFILSYMLKYFVLPVVLWGFFGWFVGAIQAFVFALLSITYTGSLLE